MYMYMYLDDQALSSPALGETFLSRVGPLKVGCVIGNVLRVRIPLTCCSDSFPFVVFHFMAFVIALQKQRQVVRKQLRR